MAAPSQEVCERRRLETLSLRDGQEAARQWARWAADLYRRSVNDPQHYASHADKRELFEKSLLQLEAFAGTGTLP